MSRYSPLARIAHFLFGFTGGLLGPLYLISFTIAFIAYEVWESVKTGDAGYLEMREYMAGLLLGSILGAILGSTR